MKIKITMKNPDTMHDAVVDAVTAGVYALVGLSESEQESMIDLRVEAEEEKLKKWFKYGEYLTVECDTETGTATVLPA